MPVRVHRWPNPPENRGSLAGFRPNMWRPDSLDSFSVMHFSNYVTMSLHLHWILLSQVYQGFGEPPSTWSMRSLRCSYDFTIIKGYKRDRIASWLVTIYPKHASHGLTDNVLWFMGCLPKINTSVGRMCLSKLPNSTLRFPTKRWQWQQQWR